MPSMQSTAILATTLLGSLLQHASAAATPTAPEAISRRAGVQFPDCIATCMRNSGCFDSKCVCKSVDKGILSDIVICMNQWCPADVTAKDLIGPLEGECDLPKAAVQDAEKKGGVASDDDDDEKEDDKDDSPKPTVTPAPTTGKGGKGGDDEEDDEEKEDKDDDDEITVTYDLAPPVTNAGPVTTVTPAVSGTLTVPTDAAATGLLIDSSSSSGAFHAAATSHHPVPSSGVSADSSNSNDSSSSDDKDKGNAAPGLAGQGSVFGVVAAMGFALAMGF